MLEDYRNKVFNGLALDICKSLPDNSIDHIVTDPPYNINYADWDKFLDIEKLSAEWIRILKPGGSLLCFAGWSFVPTLLIKMNKKFVLLDSIIYDRIKGRGTKKRLVSTREDLLWYVTGDDWVFNKDVAYSTIEKKTSGLGAKNGQKNRALSNVWTDISPIVPWSPEKTGHSTQKPLQLMERILNVFTKPGDLILDCFAGSGTTGVACAKLGRDFILVEMDKYWADYSINRIKNNTSKKLF